MMISTNTRDHFNGDIEALRALGILFVVVAHSFALFNWQVPNLMHFLTYFRFLSGVDLFFCVSGFVITQSLSRQSVKERPFWQTAKPFWIRRMFRLWPSAWLWASIILTASAIAPEQYWIGTFALTVHDFFAAIFNYMDVHLQTCSVAGTCGSVLFSVYWSLSLEEQFYLIFPVVFFCLPRKIVAGLCVFGILAQFFISRQPGTTILFFLRTDAILFGVLLALMFDHPIYRRLEPHFLGRGWIAALVAASLFYLLAFVGSAQFAPINTGLVALVSAALVFIASFNRNFIITNINPIQAVIRWIGSRSYTIYLVHLPSFWITKIAWAYYIAPGQAFNARFTLRFIITAVILCVIIAEANYQLVERPFRDWGRALAEGLSRRSERSAKTTASAASSISL